MKFQNKPQMRSNKQIVNEAISKTYDNILKESRGEYHVFFRRPLIKKGIKKLRSIWRDGGKSRAKNCKMGIRKNQQDVIFVCIELLDDERFHMWLKNNNYDKDLPKDVLKAIYFYIKGHGKHKSGDHIELDKSTKSTIYKNLNDNYFQLFVKVILKFRRDILKNERQEEE